MGWFQHHGFGTQQAEQAKLRAKHHLEDLHRKSERRALVREAREGQGRRPSLWRRALSRIRGGGD